MAPSDSRQQPLNPLARDLNARLEVAAPEVLGMLSDLGRRLYFPKGILSQTAEAKEKATRFNATFHLTSVWSGFVLRRKTTHLSKRPVGSDAISHDELPSGTE